MSSKSCCGGHETAIRRVAGSLVLIATVGAWLHSPNWLFLSGFVAVNLLQSSFTGFCPLEKILDAAQHRRGATA